MKISPIEVVSKIDSIDVLDECINEVIHDCLSQDPIELYVMWEANEKLLEVTSYIPPHITWRFEPLKKDDHPRPTLLKEEVKLELKPLPSSLRYIFLDSNSEFPFIINSSLPSIDVDALCDMLLSHRSALGYSINDLKGISPKLCMNRILLEDNAKPSIEGQRRLNPTLKEVVRKEVISDSK